MKPHPLLVFLLVVPLILLGLTGCRSLEEIHRGIGPVTMSDLKAGTYDGDAFVFPVKVRVRAEVSKGRLQRLTLLEHFNGKGAPAEDILMNVVEAQSLEVDVIAGATQSSITILQAIEVALRKGLPAER